MGERLLEGVRRRHGSSPFGTHWLGLPGARSLGPHAAISSPPGTAQAVVWSRLHSAAHSRILHVCLPQHTPGHCEVTVMVDDHRHLHSGDAFARSYPNDPVCIPQVICSIGMESAPPRWRGGPWGTCFGATPGRSVHFAPMPRSRSSGCPDARVSPSPWPACRQPPTISVKLTRRGGSQGVLVLPAGLA